MGTSQRTFEQVKSILGKLDQRIDSLRTTRSNPQPAPAAPTTGAALGLNTSVGGPAPAPAQPIGQPLTPARTEPMPLNTSGRSGYGRATPIRHAS